MKKRLIYISICLAAFFVTIYFIMFWNVNNEEKTVNVFSQSINNEDKTEISEVNSSITDITVFKLNCSEINNRLLVDQKEKLRYIVNTLSSVDLIKVNNIYTDESMTIEDRFMQINDILRKRLSAVYYKEFTNILKDYVDFESINSINSK